MAREYIYHGSFKIVTNCPDVEKIARALNETARQFADIVEYNKFGAGYMWISNDVELVIPINETQEHLYDVEEIELDIEDE